MLTYYAGGRTKKEARQAKEDSLKHADKVETERYKKAMASFKDDTKAAREKRKTARADAKQTCSVNLAKTKEQNKDKTPHRRRAEIAKARADCAFDVMNVEEHAAQDLEAVEKKRDEEVTHRRSSRIATKHNRARDKEHAKRKSKQEAREEMFDQVRNDLEADLLPYFEDIKNTPAFKKLVDDGRMTPTEAVLHLAHEDPEGVFIAIERQAEQELKDYMRELERFENEGGRLEDLVALEAETDDAPPLATSEGEPPAKRKARKPRKAKGQSSEEGKPKKARKRTAKAKSEEREHEEELERFEDEGGRPAQAHASDTRKEAETAHVEPARAQVENDNDGPISEVRTAHTAAALVRSPTIVAAPAAAPAPRASQQERRLSPEERTLWMPGTEPAVPAPPEETSPMRTALFDAEYDTVAEASGDQRHHSEDAERAANRKRTDPHVQQTFATDYSSWLAQGGAQMTLDSAPTRTAAASSTAASTAAVPNTAPTTRVTSQRYADATLTVDRAQNMIFVQFADQPTPQTRTNLRYSDFRWAAEHQRWEGPFTEQRLINAESLLEEYIVEEEMRREVHKAHAAHQAAAEAASVAERPAASNTTKTQAVAPAPAPVERPLPITAPTSQVSSKEYGDATLTIDRAQKLIHVRFEERPRAQFRIALRAAGFRWMPVLERWQAPLDTDRKQAAEDVLTEHAKVIEAQRARRGGAATPAGEAASPASLPETENDDDDEPTEQGAELSDLDARRAAYEEKQASRVARLHAKADALQAASNTVYQTAHSRADRIPFGQPILVGHHSEGRDRRFRAKIDKGFSKAFELRNEAAELRRKAEAAENNTAISSDDPDAIPKLEAKVNERGAFIRRARTINEVIRGVRARHKRPGWEEIAQQRMTQLGITPEQAANATRKDIYGQYGVPGWATKNAQAEIARLNRRIENLKERDARPVREPERIGDATITEDRIANRLQIRFEGLPPDELRSALRGRGFVWAPSVKAWQRKLNENAQWAARYVLRQHYPDAPKAPAPVVPHPEEPAPTVALEREPGLDDDPYVPDPSTPHNADDVVPF